MKNTWIKIWARKYAPFLGTSYNRVFSKKNPFFVCKNKLFLPEGNLNASYFNKREWQSLVKKYDNFLSRQNLKKYAYWYESQFRDALSWAKRFSKTEFGNLTNSQLAGLVDQIASYFVRFGEIQFLAFVVLHGAGHDLEKALASFKNKDEILQWIATPYKLTLISKIRLQLLRMKNEKKTSAVYLKKFLKKFAWVPMYDFADPPWTLKAVKEELALTTNPKREIYRFKQERRECLDKYRKFLRALTDKKLRRLAETMHYFAYLKEMRDDYRRQILFILIPFWEELGKKLGISRKDANYLVPDELITLLKTHKKPSKKTIKKRQKSYTLVIINGKEQIFSKDASPGFLGLAKKNNKTSVRGQAACAGKISGKVRVVYHRGEFEKFKTGDILITTMTHPEFLPIMKRAKAIVTDEGGITSHAAIVARELKKPCIIGTKTATKVFRDGDMVEVDANKGVVRRIK